MQYTKSDTTVSAETIKAMREQGIGSEWTNPRTGKVRYYLNASDLDKLIGLSVSYYKSGYCSGCSYERIDGERVQVAHSRGWSDWSKVYVESDGHVYSGWEPESDCIAELVAMRINEVCGGIDPDGDEVEERWMARAEKGGYLSYDYATEAEAEAQAAELNVKWEGRGYHVEHVTIGRVTGRVRKIEEDAMQTTTEYEVRYQLDRNPNIEGAPYATLEEAREAFEAECAAKDSKTKTVWLVRTECDYEGGECNEVRDLEIIETRTI